MARSVGLALLLTTAAVLVACEGYEQQKQSVVRSVSAAVFQQFLSIQRCATLTQGAVKASAPPEFRAKAVPAPPTDRRAVPVGEAESRARVCPDSREPAINGRLAEVDTVKPRRRLACAG